MPAEKRSLNLQQQNNGESSPQQHRLRRKQSRHGGGAVDQPPTTSSSAIPQSPLQQEQHSNEKRQEDQSAVYDQNPVDKSPQDDSDGSGTDTEEFDEIITVLRSELRSIVQCPICLGIIKKTRTVMGCLHRFCRDCIDKSMRLGNNECPACRIHCASRRSLRDDQDYDSLIDAIYPDAEKYEEEELVFGEEDKTRNEQIQASIAQIYRRQSEAMNKRRRVGKEADDCSLTPLPRSCRNLYSRRRKKQKIEVEGCANEKVNDGNQNLSPSGKHGNEIKCRRRKRRTGDQASAGSPSTANGIFGNSVVQISEKMSTPLGAVRNAETLSWGRGGARSHTRHGGGGSSRLTRGSPLSKLIDRLEGVTIAESELKPESRETKLPIEGPETLSAKSTRTSSESGVNTETLMHVPNSSSPNVPRPGVGEQVLDHKETLVGIRCPSHSEHLVGGIHA